MAIDFTTVSRRVQQENRAFLSNSFVDEKPDHELTQGQQQAYDEIVDWILNEKETRYKVLSGRAGTGKTFLLNKIVNRVKTSRKVKVTATTNKAVKVLKELINHDSFSTIHSVLNIKAYTYEDLEIFKPDKWGKEDINNYDVVIVDECSMISKKLLKIISEQIKGTTKVLFVGDSAQLQPVNEAQSRCFIYNPVELTEIVRYGNEIALKADIVRQSGKQPVDIKSLIDGEYLQKIGIDDLKELFKDFRSRPDDIRITCWTNNRRKMWNKFLRACDYGYNPIERFVAGDYVMAYETCFAGDEILMGNAEEGTILDVEELENSFMLRIQKNEGSKVVVNVIKEEYIPALDEQLEQLKADKEWREYWMMKKAFHDVDFCYATTVHKSQGSTFKNIGLDIHDMNLNKDIVNRNQLIYTGMTRATDKVYII